MKKIICLCALMMAEICSWAQNPQTNDHVTISEAIVQLGENYETISVSLENASKYSTFGLDIFIPQGYEFVQVENDDEEMVYADRGLALKNGHTLFYEPQKNGSLRVTSLSGTSATLKTNYNELFKFYIKATSYAKPGAAGIQIRNCFFVTSEGVKYVTDDITISDKVSSSNNSTAPITVNSTAKWSTCILPFNVDLPSGVKAYTCSEKNDESLILRSAASIEAYTPYILYSEEGFIGNVSGTVDESKYPNNGYVSKGFLKGAIEPQKVSTGFVLQNLTEGVKFYSCGGDVFNIPAGKCWVDFIGVANAQSFSFQIVDDVTKVEGIKNLNTAVKDNIYTLSGTQVANMQPNTIYIKNGKKIIVGK